MASQYRFNISYVTDLYLLEYKGKIQTSKYGTNIIHSKTLESDLLFSVVVLTSFTKHMYSLLSYIVIKNPGRILVNLLFLGTAYI